MKLYLPFPIYLPSVVVRQRVNFTFSTLLSLGARIAVSVETRLWGGKLGFSSHREQ
jgi:hypothetical protein